MSLEDRLYPLLKRYSRLPQGVQRALGFTYRHLPQTWRWGKQYPEFKRLALDGEQWLPDQVRDYQLKELRRTLLVRVERSGPFVYYELADPRILTILGALKDLATDLLAARTSF